MSVAVQLELGVEVAAPKAKRLKRRVRLTKEEAAAQGFCGNCRSKPAVDGLRSCTSCVAANKKWREANRKSHVEANKRWKERNPEHVRAMHRAWREANPEAQARLSDLQNLRYKLRQHGATVAEFQALMAAQGGVCAICKSPDPKNKLCKRLYVDHCHTTNRIRGLLCRPCNSVLGFVQDQPDVLREAAAYLEARR